MIRATVITDASHCPFTDAGGYGAWIRIDGRNTALKYSGPLTGPIGSSTFAEVRAALIGIWYAAKNGATHVMIQSDCMTIIHLSSGQCKNPVLVKMWLDAFARPDMRVMLTARHVKGHGKIKDARTYVNAWCDEFAKLHMNEGRKAARRKAKA